MHGSHIPHEDQQHIAFVQGVEHMWNECKVPLNACVIRYWNRKKNALDHIVLVTTNSNPSRGLGLSGIMKNVQRSSTIMNR